MSAAFAINDVNAAKRPGATCAARTPGNEPSGGTAGSKR
jgi:hypothetical protein